MDHGWQFWIDRGGTFTDVVGRRPDGALHTLKLLSEDAAHYPDAAVEGVRRLLGLGPDDPVPAEAIDAVKMGTTVATNALLERQGAPTLLVVTRGFADLLEIGYQTRPKLFALHIEKPELLHARVLEAIERVDAQGNVLIPLDEAAARAGLARAYGDGFRACAIALMHGYRFTGHEARLAEIAAEAGFTQVSASHAVSPLMKIVSRADTTVVDAYLSPVLRRYVDRVAAALGGVRLLFMQSNGGLVDAHRFQGKDAILSGPAGGVVGMARTGRMAGFERLIGFDMGGTSTDVSHYDGEYERAFETQVAGIRMRAPIMQIHTVAAGGGSILGFDGARFRVGPKSAGADPGPACYRRGGPLTVTDCNVVLGKIQPRHFPAVFGPGADEPLDSEAPRRLFEDLARRIGAATGDAQTPEQVAEGFLRIAVDNMANAIKKVSVQRGHDVTEYTLNCFGGAGGQHACLVADALGMEQVLVHPFAGVLSAYGMGLADRRVMRERSIALPLSGAGMAAIGAALDALEAEARGELAVQGVAADGIRAERKVHLRYAGSDTAIAVDFAPLADMAQTFEGLHKNQFGFVMAGSPMIAEVVATEAIAETADRDEPRRQRPPGAAAAKPSETVTMTSGGARHQAPVYDRAALQPGERIAGPAIIAEATATTVLEPGWGAEITGLGHMVLRRIEARPRGESIGTRADPVMLEVFNNLFMAIAEQMGAALQNTAYSVNIKERLDFSCAIFDPLGNLVANAPHMPVHLGSMGESIRSVAAAHAGRMKAGQVFVLNAPYNGGTHLPDITVVTPLFDAAGAEILFFVGSRGHHADVGGITPGSMPAWSRSVEEEGVIFDNLLLVDDGRFLEDSALAVLGSGPWPARNPRQNIADLKAQVAANERGAGELLAMIGHFGLHVVQAYMGHVQDNAEESVRLAIGRLRSGAFDYATDDDARHIKVSVSVDAGARQAVLDFTGTSAQDAGNFNAPSAIARAAALYVFRTLVDDDIPMNEGCLKPLKLILPEPGLLAPAYPAAVVAGNVETSQAIVDALYGALGVMGAAQGTMNNFTFGNDVYQYYETICGGAGAGPGFDGADAIHSHMTNSRLTDPEVLEWRFPVLLEEFSVRRGSGGKGANRGGDGVIRRLRFLEPMTAAILSGHRRVPPYGMNGGEPGAVGVNSVRRADGSLEPLGGIGQVEMRPGDAFIIETPGGGGYGTPAAE